MIIGRIDPRKMLAVGLVGSAFSLMALSRINLNAGYWDLFWPQFLQGIFMAMLFVPLTTITMDAIPKEEMGNATSLFNLMRNIGGSVGIAVATTLISRSSQTFVNRLGTHVNPYNPAVALRVDQMRAYFMSRGADMATATREAYAAVNGMVQQQAALLSYLNEFKIFGAIFLAMLPLVLLMKRPARSSGPVAMH